MTAIKTTLTPCQKPGFRAFALGSTFLISLLATQSQADDLVWDPADEGTGAGSTGGASNTWDTSTTNWYNETTPAADVAFTFGDSVFFRAPPGETVELGQAIIAGGITFESDGYLISGGPPIGFPLAVTGDIVVTTAGDSAEIATRLALDATVSGAGDLTLSGTVDGTVNNTGTGTVTVLNVIEAIDNDSGTTVMSTGAVTNNIVNNNSVDGGEVNVTGGMLQGATVVTGTGLLDIDDGDLGPVDNTSATSTVEISGGTVALLTNTDGTTTMDGGTLDSLVVNGGDVTTTGGGITFDVDVTGGTLTLGNTVSGDAAVSGTGAMTITTGADVAGAVTNSASLTLDDGTVASLTNTDGTASMDGGAITGDLDVSGGAVTTTAGSIGGDVDVTGGTLALGNAVSGDAAVSGTGAMTITTGADVAGAVTNSASLTLDDGTVASLTNTDGTASMDGGAITGDLDVSGGAVTTTAGSIGGDVDVTGGTLALGNAVSGDAAVSGTGAMTITTGADVAGAVTNSASLTLDDGTVASLTNTDGTASMDGGAITGDLDVSGGAVTTTAGSIGGDVDVTGGTLALGNAVSGDAAVSGTGAMTITTGADVAGAVTNSASLTLDDGTVASLTNTDGTASMDGGAITGDLDVSGGAVTTTAGSIGGDVDVTGGTLALGNAVSGDAAVSGTGAMTLNPGGSIAGTLTNDATFTFAGGSIGDVDNTGTFILSGDQTVDGTFNNSGLLDATEAGAQTLTTADTFTTSGDITTDGSSTLTITSPLIDVLAGANFNSVAELDGTVILDGAVTSAADLEVTGPYTLRGSFDNAGVLTVSDTLDTGGFALTNTSGGQLIAAGTITGTVTNAGDFDVTGGTVGDIDNLTSGDTTVTGATSMTGDVTNAGTFALDDGTVASLTNTDGTASMDGGAITGDLDVSGGAVTTTAGSIGGDVDVTGGTLALGNAVSGDAAVSGTGAMTLNPGGSIAGTLTNDATFTFAGGSIGDVDNTGTFILSGDQTVDGTFNNSGLLDATEAGAQTLTTADTFTTSGDITTDGSSTLTITSPLIDVLAGANFNSVAELDGTVILDGAVTSAADLEVTGPYTLRGSFDNAGVLTVSDTLDTGGFALTNTSGGQLIAAGTITGTVTNAGDFDVTGGTVGDIDNLTSGDTTVTGATSMTGDVTNAGTFALDDGTVASLTNTDGTASMDGGAITGDLDVSGGAVTTTAGSIGGDVDVTGGTLALGNAVSGDAAVSGTGAMTLNPGGSIAGTLTNDATFTFAGGSIGDVDNLTAGDVTVTGSAAVTGALDSIGTIDIDSGASLSVAGLTSINDGSLNVDGTFLGDLTVGSAGALTANSGSVLGSGTQTFINNGSSSFDLFGTVDGDLVANGGISSIGGTVTRSLTANSGAIVNVSDGATVGTYTQNSGTVSLVDGNPTTDLNISGDAIFNGTIALDVDLSDDSTAGDTINVGGNVSGSAVLSFSAVGESDIDDIALITYGGSNTLTFSSLEGLPRFGEFEYFLSDTGAGVLSLRSRVNSGIASLASSIGVTQTIVGSVINRPTSPYVADLATDPGDLPCGAGAWARPTYGQADASGTFDDVNSGTTGETPIDLIYRGIQIGGDFACFDDRYGGFDMAFGVIGGYNDGDTTTLSPTLNLSTGVADGPVGSVTTTDFNQTFAGVYMTASRDRFFADLQMRYEVTNFTSSNKEIIPGAGFDLDKSKYDTTGGTVSGAVGYAMPIESVEGLNVVGSMGFSYSEFNTDSIDLGDDGTVQLEDSKIKLGFLSGTIARTKLQPDEISLINYFGTATVYNDFADDPVAKYIDSTDTANPIRLSKLGTYGEISAGLNYVRLLSAGGDGKPRQLNVAGRFDYRKGDNLESWGITAQVRYQF